MMATIRDFLSKHFLTRIAMSVAILFCFGYVFLWGSGIASEYHLADKIIAAYFLSWGLYTFLSKMPRHEVQKRFLSTTMTILLS